MVDLFRPQREDERNLKSGGFKDVRSWREVDIEQFYRKKIAETEQRFHNELRQPYCTKCAIKEVEKKIKEIGEKLREADESKQPVPVDTTLEIDFDKFGGSGKDDKFTRVSDKILPEKFHGKTFEEDVQGPEYKGSNRYVFKGVHRNFICKVCYGGNTIFFSVEELEKEKQTTTQNTPPKRNV